jgi:hypothetical protein
MPDREQPDKKRSAETMDADHVFRFHCSPGVACFTRCCADVTIALTPYDVIRLKNALGISSDAFLEKYTMISRPTLITNPRPFRIFRHLV